MNARPYSPTDLEPTGKRFRSVDEWMPDSDFPEAVLCEAREHESRRRMTLDLARMRTRAGVSLAEMASLLNLSPSEVLKLENGDDTALTARHLNAYETATGLRVRRQVK